MDTMNDLLICALAVGKNDPHKATIKARNIHGSIRDGVWLVDTEEWYDPRTNDAQAYQLEDYLFDNEWVIDKVDGEYWFCHPSINCIRNKSRKDGAIKAVVAMEDTHE